MKTFLFRDTQTLEQKHQNQQTFNPTNTQMTKIGVYVSNMPDRLVVPGPYTTADEHQRKIFDRVRAKAFALRRHDVYFIR